jgi:hypothetical protein
MQRPHAPYTQWPCSVSRVVARSASDTAGSSAILKPGRVARGRAKARHGAAQEAPTRSCPLASRRLRLDLAKT